SFRSMKVQKFHYCCIEFCSHFRSPALLPHGQPSALKRSKSAFLLVGHGPLISALPTPTPQFYEQSIDSRGPALCRSPPPEPPPPVIGGGKTDTRAARHRPAARSG